mgnify:CR=1 FL=1
MLLIAFRQAGFGPPAGDAIMPQCNMDPASGAAPACAAGVWLILREAMSGPPSGGARGTVYLRAGWQRLGAE